MEITVKVKMNKKEMLKKDFLNNNSLGETVYSCAIFHF